MRPIAHFAWALAASLALASSAAAGVQCALHDGRITLVARDATVGEILAAWAKAGQITVVGLESAPGDRVTIELVDVTEEQALAVVLRKGSGYIAAPRTTFVAEASRFDRILIMPFSTPAPTPAPTQTAAPDTSAMNYPTLPTAAAEAVPEVVPPADDPIATTVDIPVSELRAQAAIRARQALEVVDPRQFQFPVRPPAGPPRQPGVK